MPVAVEPATIADELLARLRALDACEGATYAEAPDALVGGYDTAIFSFRLSGTAAPWDRALILRLFRPEHDDRPRIEAAVQNAVADVGYPCPRVVLAGGGDRIGGRPYMIMERVGGRPLIRYITSPGRMTLRATPVLAEAHARLHALDAMVFRERLVANGLTDADLHCMTFEAEFQDVAEIVAGLKVAALMDVLAWLEAHRPVEASRVICHGDFHPVNVMLQPDGTYHVIDWTMIRFAEPEYDIARSVILWRRAPIDRTLVRGVERALIGIGRRTLLWRYGRLYRRWRAVDEERLRYYEAFDALRVIATTFVGRNTSLWRDHPVIDGLMGHIRQRTGLKLGPVPVI
jgi:aminoglycoside phosphotransferase (APT) family kinase protein